MALGNSKQLHHQTSYYPIRGLKLFPKTYSTNACNIIWNGAQDCPESKQIIAKLEGKNQYLRKINISEVGSLWHVLCTT
jgi:hypothetical protein